jgi:cell division protease FtsH
MSKIPGSNKDDKNDKKFNPFGDFKKNDDDNPQMKFLKNALLWVLLLGGIVIVWMVMNSTQRGEKAVSFTQYESFLKGDMIEKLTVRKSQLNDYEVAGVLKRSQSIEIKGKKFDLKRFVTKIGILDDNTEALWRAKGINLTYEEKQAPFWEQIIYFLPWIMIIGLFIFLARKMQGGGGGSKGIFSFGKSKAKLLNEHMAKVTFKDVAGADEAKYELEEIIEFLKLPEKFQRLGGKIPRGVLLLGPPGTGKTLMARAVAGEAEVPFYSISGADFVEMFVGVGASRVRDLFEQAKKNSPCIVFIDEIDAVGRHRGAGLGGGHDEREQTLNQLLVEMDGFEQNSGVIIIAATNRPDVLDPALLRPGRFDRQVVMDRPDVKGREGIFKVHTKKIPLGDDVDLNVLAKGTPGLSGADIANIVNEAALLGARRNSDKVTMYDFENAKDKILMGIERKSMVISDKEKEMTAYHEMGHALVGKFIPDNSYPVHKVTIIPRGRALGLTSYLPSEEFHSISKDQIETQIIIALGGRAAEKIIFNQVTTGASSDIERATQLSKKMVCDWGMSEVLGPVKYANKQEEVFLGREMTQNPDHSESTAQKIDDEVRNIVLSCSDKAVKILTDNLEMLHIASKVLIEREVLDGEELDMIVKGEDLPPISKQALNAMRSIKIESNGEEDKVENDVEEQS